jgi:hypothetical protein
MPGAVDQVAFRLPEPALSLGQLYRLPGCSTKMACAADLVLAGGQWITFDALLACTGMVPRVPTAFRAIPHVTTLRTLADAQAIRVAATACGRARSPIAVAGWVSLAARLRPRYGCSGSTSCSPSKPRLLCVQSWERNWESSALRQHMQHGVEARMRATMTALELAGAGSMVAVCLDDGTSPVGRPFVRYLRRSQLIAAAASMRHAKSCAPGQRSEK